MMNKQVQQIQNKLSSGAWLSDLSPLEMKIWDEYKNSSIKELPEITEEQEAQLWFWLNNNEEE